MEGGKQSSILARAMLLLGTAALALQPITASAASAVQEPKAAPDPAVAGEAKPALYEPQDDLERGLWLQMDEYERDLKSSQQVIHDEALNSYVRGVLCKVVGDECGNIRLYIMRTPHFNASMAPNGVMQIWSGLLLRIQNEAQLAAVLGHEYAHFRERHSVQLFRKAKEKSNAAAWLAFTGIGLIASIVLVGSIFKFSREQEQEADLESLKYISAAGYDPGQAAVIWEQLLDEDDATREARGRKKQKRNKKAGLFAAHPPSMERVTYLREQVGASRYRPGTIGDLAYQQAMQGWWPVFLDDQLKMNDSGGSLFLLDAMTKANGATPWLTYARAELLRSRGGEGDFEAALDHYSEAMAKGGTLPELWRGRGLVLRKLGRKDEAKADLEEYLSRAPDAPDRAMIAMISGGE